MVLEIELELLLTKNCCGVHLIQGLIQGHRIQKKNDEITKGVWNLKYEATTFQLKEFPLAFIYIISTGKILQVLLVLDN